MPLRRHEPGPRQNRKVRGHGIVRHREFSCDVARRQPVRLVLDQQAKHVEPRRLRQGGKSVTMNCGYGQGYAVRQVIDMVRGRA